MPTTADELLQEVIKGWEVEKVEDAERERAFANAREDQRKLLAAAKAKEARAEALSQALEKEYQENEITIAELEEALTQRMGNLGELFGVTRQIAGDTRGNVEASITTAQYGRERVDFLENPYPYGAQGAKGIGELPLNGPPPAVVSAVVDALGDALVEEPTAIPLTPERLMDLLDAGAAAPRPA